MNIERIAEKNFPPSCVQSKISKIPIGEIKVWCVNWKIYCNGLQMRHTFNVSVEIQMKGGLEKGSLCMTCSSNLDDSWVTTRRYGSLAGCFFLAFATLLNVNEGENRDEGKYREEVKKRVQECNAKHFILTINFFLCCVLQFFHFIYLRPSFFIASLLKVEMKLDLPLSVKFILMKDMSARLVRLKQLFLLRRKVGIMSRLRSLLKSEKEEEG